MIPSRYRPARQDSNRGNGPDGKPLHRNLAGRAFVSWWWMMKDVALLRAYAEQIASLAKNLAEDCRNASDPEDRVAYEYALCYLLKAKGSLGTRAAKLDPTPKQGMP
jgi:hypothetical protein